MTPVEKQDELLSLVRTAFGKRRKMLKSSLKEMYLSEKIESSLIDLGLNPLQDRKTLSREDFINLHLKLIK
jgi:16S rRNA (adenine1518-N6/adenine1519-N6)-dimethyltransferase